MTPSISGMQVSSDGFIPADMVKAQKIMHCSLNQILKLVKVWRANLFVCT